MIFQIMRAKFGFERFDKSIIAVTNQRIQCPRF